MFRVSSRTHYALRAMTELAKAFGSKPLAVSEIARVEGIPEAYLEQLVASLRRAGLVAGTRGLHGGYRLARPPAEVTVAEVVQAMEGPLALVECQAEEYRPGECEREQECLSRGIWHRVRQSIEQVLRSTTLEDLCAEQSGPLLPMLPLAAANGAGVATSVGC